MSIISSRSGFQIRPRFEVETKHSAEALYNLLQQALNSDEAPFSSKLRKGFAHIFPKEENHEPWSPHLSISYEAIEDGTLIRGHYGPSPGLWTMFVFIYAVIGLAIMICLIIGFSNISIGASGWILWLVPVLIIMLASCYLVSYLGQQKSRHETLDLHHYLEDIIGKHIE